MHSSFKPPIKLTIHIVYTPGCVKYLSLFLFSLLRWSTCTFRLIANGCRPDEIAFLQALCHRNSRLELQVLPYKLMVSHGKVLNYLHSQTSEEYFCFMDSDILATDEFLNNLLLYSSQYVGIFSASPVWCKHEEQTLSENCSRMQGRHNTTTTGDCLGGTYFALYRTSIVTQLIQSSGIDFKRFLWSEIPLQYQRLLIKMGLKKEKYDTGKLLNFLLLEQGEALIFKESPSLHHVGGVSAYNTFDTNQPWVAHLKNRLSQSLDSGSQVPGKSSTFDQVQNLTTLGLAVDDNDWMALMKNHGSVSKRRLTVSRYITHLLRALFEDSPMPAIPELNEPALKIRLELITISLCVLYQEYRELLIAV